MLENTDMNTLALLALLLGATFVGSPRAMASAPAGSQLYLRHCAPCHGPEGKGDGPNAAMFSAQPRNLRAGVVEKYSTKELVRRIRDGRSLELALDVEALRARARTVESVVSYMKRLPNIDWSIVDEGWGLYIDRCETCHGPFGRPRTAFPAGVRAPRDLSDPAFQRSVTDEALESAVQHGRRGMPALTPRLTSKDAQFLVGFVRLLSPGFETYTLYCNSCHGDGGLGVGSFGESIALPTIHFDRAYFARTDPQTLRRRVWHMLDEHKPSMPHFHWTISEGEAGAIIEYLRQLQ
jgi:mono/diheme cytochrome c family protein